jgi:molybdopterin-guanine dinucleotide biosynthesis protein A
MKLDTFILAGGRSSRMGFDKATLRMRDGQLMLEQVVSLAMPVAQTITLVRRTLGAAELPLDIHERITVIQDLASEEHHPLWGVATALLASSTEYAIVLSCDVPYVPTDYLRELVARRVPAGVIAADGDYVHPLIGVYHKSMAEPARGAAAAGYSMRRFTEQCLRLQGESNWFRNINSPTDLN